MPTALTATRNAFDVMSLSASLNGATFSGVGGALNLGNDRTCLAGAESCAFADQIAAIFNRAPGGTLSINITATTTDPSSPARPAILSGSALSDLIASLTSGAVLTEANGQSTIQITGSDLGPNCSFISTCQVFATFDTFTIRQPAPDPDLDVVPLPAGLPLLLAGLGGLALLRRRK